MFENNRGEKQMVNYSSKFASDCSRGHMIYKYKNIRIYTIIKEYALTYWYTVVDTDKKRVIPELDIRTLESYKGFENTHIYLHREKCVPEIIQKALKHGELTDEMWVSLDEFENAERKKEELLEFSKSSHKPVFIYNGEEIDELINKLCSIIPESEKFDGKDIVIGYILITDLNQFESLPTYIGYKDIIYGWQIIVDKAISEFANKIESRLLQMINKFTQIVSPDLQENKVLLEFFNYNVLFNACLLCYDYKKETYVDALIEALRYIHIHQYQFVDDFIQQANFVSYNIDSALTNWYQRDIRGIVYEERAVIKFGESFDITDIFNFCAASYKCFLDNILSQFNLYCDNDITKIKLLLNDYNS